MADDSIFREKSRGFFEEDFMSQQLIDGIALRALKISSKIVINQLKKPSPRRVDKCQV